MSKMGTTIAEIQELAYQGFPSEQIAKVTKTSLPFVEDVVKNYFEDEFNGVDDEQPENR